MEEAILACLKGELTLQDLAVTALCLLSYELIKGVVRLCWSFWLNSRKPNSHDKELWERISAILPPNTRTLLREHDFGVCFHKSATDPLYELYGKLEGASPEWAFINKKLERLKTNLLEQLDDLVETLSEYTTCDRKGLCSVKTGNPDPDLASDIESQRAAVLNNTCKSLCMSYDNLASEAKKKFNHKI